MVPVVLIDTLMSPEMQVEPPPVDVPMAPLEKPSVVKLVAAAEVTSENCLRRSARGRKVELFIVARRCNATGEVIKKSGR